MAVLLRIDLDTGARKLIEDTRGKRAPDVAVQRACLKHLILRQILEHCAVEENARCGDCDPVEVGKCGLRCASSRGSKRTARSGECVDGAHIFLGDHLIPWNQCTVQVADKEDIVVSFFTHNASISVR